MRILKKNVAWEKRLMPNQLVDFVFKITIWNSNWFFRKSKHKIKYIW